MRGVVLSFIALNLSSSCASPSAQSVAGHYERIVPMNGGGELELKVDGTYTFSWEDIADITEDDGSLLARSGVEHGRWTQAGARVVFSTDEHPCGDRAENKLHGSYILDAQGRLQPVDGEFGERFKKRRPNQSPEPTVMLVTPRADARVAPSTTVAHL